MRESLPSSCLSALSLGETAVQRFALGCVPLDAALGGGLARARLHEIVAAGEMDLTSATGFALMLALRAGGPAGNIVWLAQADGACASGPLYPPGLAELGADPARLLFVTVADEAGLLKAAADIARSPAAGTLVIAPAAPARRIDLTATRRLTLFAERSGVTTILLRGAVEPAASAASSRWRIAAAPSAALDADAPGAPAFTAECVRRRDGPPVPGRRLEWDRDALAFLPLEAAPLSGDLAAAPGRGQLASG